MRRRAGLVATLPFATAAVVGWQLRRAMTAEYLPDTDYEVVAEVGSGRTTRLAVLGDSTVAGIGATGPSGTLPVLLAERVAGLAGACVHVVGHGVSGARTRDIAAQADGLADEPFDVVVVVIGSNDVTHVSAPWTLRRETRTMLAHVRVAAGEAQLVFGGIPEFATVPALDRPLRSIAGFWADVLRAQQRAAAAEAGVPFVDIAREASPLFIGRPESMSVDLFHPSTVGYGLWADALAPVVADVVRRR